MKNEISFEEFRQEWLTDVRAGSPSTVELGRRFAYKLITQWLDISEPSDDLVYCDGAGDGGIDIAYLYRSDVADAENVTAEGHTWYLVQSKYGKAFQGKMTLLAEGQKVVETLAGHRTSLSSLAQGLQERLAYFRGSAGEMDHVVLVFATEEPLTDGEKRVLEDIRTIGRTHVGSLFDVESISISTIFQRVQETEIALSQIVVPLQSNLVPSGVDLLIGSTRLLDLYEFLKEYRRQTDDLDHLYERNVRRFLGSRGRINRAIQQTLQQNPDRFGLYNNGITIVVQDYQLTPDNDKHLLIEPYIVNGCQTTRTIWEVFHRRLEAGGTGTNPELEEWRAKAERGVVVTKVVKVGADGEPLMQAITRYTNSQNAVREKDFLALTSDFRTWALQMAEQYGVFLEVQRGGWESQKARQKQRPDIQAFDKYANAFDLLKVYASGWLMEAGTAFGRNSAFVPNGTIFKRIMNNEDSVEPFSVEDLYGTYLLQCAADSYQFGRNAEMPRRQTRFLFYLVVIDLLRDVLARAGIERIPKNFTRAILGILDGDHPDAAQNLLRAGIGVIDTYMTKGTNDNVFLEPAFLNTYNSDLNGFLKWEQLGKNENATPRLRAAISSYRMLLTWRPGAEAAPIEAILQAIPR